MRKESNILEKIKKLPIVAKVIVYLFVGMFALFVFGRFLLSSNNDNRLVFNKPEKVNVNGLNIKEACKKLEESGWVIDEVESDSYDEKSDCSDESKKVSDINYDETFGEVSLYFTGEKKLEVKSSNNQFELAMPKQEVKQESATMPTSRTEEYPHVKQEYKSGINDGSMYHGMSAKGTEESCAHISTYYPGGFDPQDKEFYVKYCKAVN